MIKFNGFREALKALRSMSREEQEKIIKEIAIKDRKMAQELENSLIQIDDLISLTPKMMYELIGAISVEILALALRGANEQTRKHIEEVTPSSAYREMKEIIYGPPRSADEVHAAMGKLMVIVQKLIQEGKILLDKNMSDKLV